MFLLKKIIAPFLLPLPFCLLISFLGLFLLWRGRMKTTGKVLVTVGLVLLTVFSYFPVSRVMNAPLNGRYEAFFGGSGSRQIPENRKKVAYVVVLGGGHNSHSSIPVPGRLSGDSLIRLLEGIRIYRLNPGSKLVLSGGGAYDPVPEAQGMADVARFVGVNSDDLILEKTSLDTKDQARIVKTIVGDRPFVLVTSATHLPRSMALFRKMGMAPVPGPAGPTCRAAQPLTSGDFFPDSNALDNSSRALHEYVGLLWAKMRGQI
ncbi:MAG TPA: DUF218 domain-containing protein [Deltaproteobacteria bacterium]|nr:DUF218 domain-containing protein [Deltaproteobacteria bacterium]